MRTDSVSIIAGKQTKALDSSKVTELEIQEVYRHLLCASLKGRLAVLNPPLVFKLQNTHNIKFPILAIFKYTVQWY